jgi:hypothetical protein
MDLSHLRDVMMDSRSLWRTLRAQGTEWRDHDLLREAFMRRYPPGPNTLMVQATIERPPKPIQSWSLSIELPDRIRTEFGVSHEQVTAVIRGTSWWSISSHDAPRTSDGDPKHRHGTGPGYPLTEPRRLVFALELEPQEEMTFAGQPAVRVSATPAEPSHEDRLEAFAMDEAASDLGIGADRYELIVDTERGVILRSEAQLDGSPYLIIEMRSVGFDEPLLEETFRLEAPPGTTFSKRNLFDEIRRKGPDDDAR